MSDRACKQCGKGIIQRLDEQTGNFSRRWFCGGRCRSLWTAARQIRTIRKPIYARIAEVLQRDPDLEGWQIAERFGLNHGEARELRRRLRQQMARAS